MALGPISEVTQHATDLRRVSETTQRAVDEVGRFIVGKDDVLRQILMGLMADGHILLQDFPGLAKTMIAQSFAQVLDIRFTRIQFTPDLLPGEITGGYIYNQREAAVRVPARARCSPICCSATRSIAPLRRRSRRCSKRCRSAR